MARETIARPPHEGRRFANSDVDLQAALPASRLSLRVAPQNAGDLTKALGVELPITPKTSASGDGRHALWLGPDEWLIIDDRPNIAPTLVGELSDCSAVDISHRNTAIHVSGAKAEELLNAGCPQNLTLAAFPVGACSRTIFGKVEIVLWRTGKRDFRIEVWRSFSDYIWDFLVDAARSV